MKMPTFTDRAAKFFAGIGLTRMALQRQGWEVVFANDIVSRKAAQEKAWGLGRRLMVMGKTTSREAAQETSKPTTKHSYPLLPGTLGEKGRG